MTILINLTPHDINLINDQGECYLTIPPTSPPARCEEKYTQSYKPMIVDDNYIEHGYLSYSSVYDLPERNLDQETYYIVSVLVAQQQPLRPDLLVPADLVRESGRIIGCKKLVRVI